ncbi:GGDEF domain-containing protein [Roseomonas eburnea]|uniref:diguanylate cyclase n=1 Tax=Neoroseomonas eburnea TaxID=1346889 RepID=A0A9X9XKN3_9PROT|nr:GGDEF domain-containing protein [Neoroseomonas eburnea]MBR0684269.1 GGDEF domain-containing protein [Neoroseomonas eburnea]
MTFADQAFLAARLGIGMLCVWAMVVAVARYRAAGPGTGKLVLRQLLAVLVLGIVLIAFDAWDNTIVRQGDPINIGTWLWLTFDAAVPLLVLAALEMMAERDAIMAQLARAAVTDPLTGLANRRGFSAAAETAVSLCRRQDMPAAMIVFDLDRFKAINDGHGHAAGDAVLAGMAGVLRRHLRAGDIVGRLGGEEFAVLCPGLDAAGAAAVAERLRAAQRLEVPHPAGPGEAVTASAGVAELAPTGDVATSLEAALAAADRALYAAKAAGRDRVVLAPA